MSRARIEPAPDGYYLNRTPLFAFTLLCCLFALWGTAANLNDVLIAQFRKAFFLSDFESAFVQSAFYLGYFFVAIPAATVVKKFSYKTTILVGLLLYTIGCLLFFPAASMAKYGMFLVALFVIAAGLSFLETASNSYSTLMGPRATSTRRLNISQTFYPFGAMAGVVMGSFLIFKEGDASHAQLAAMSAADAHLHQLAMIRATLEPYRWLIAVLAAVFVVFALTPYPACKGNGSDAATHRVDARGTLARLAGNRRFVAGVVAQFLYVGAQVGVWSFTIRLAMQIGGLTERGASRYLLATFFAFFVEADRDARDEARRPGQGANRLRHPVHRAARVHDQRARHHRGLHGGRRQHLPWPVLADHLRPHDRRPRQGHRVRRLDPRDEHRRRRRRAADPGADLRPHRRQHAARVRRAARVLRRDRLLRLPLPAAPARRHAGLGTGRACERALRRHAQSVGGLSMQREIGLRRDDFREAPRVLYRTDGLTGYLSAEEARTRTAAPHA
nr:sugar MFS transporter [Burkholderia ubonensis]